MEITDAITIPDAELHFSFARSGGPGGQNVNKVESKAILRWDVAANTSLPPDVKDRLRAQQQHRITAEGELLIQGQRFRDQERNKQDCLDRLREMVLRALTQPRKRKPTKPTRGSRERRLANKKMQARRKAGRRPPAAD